MKPYKKTYFKAFGFDPDDKSQWVPSELSNGRGVDIHHICNREDRIENLMAVTREEHLKFGEIKSKMWFLLDIHREYLILNGIPFDNSWFEKMMAMYEPYMND